MKVLGMAASSAGKCTGVLDQMDVSWLMCGMEQIRSFHGQSYNGWLVLCPFWRRRAASSPPKRERCFVRRNRGDYRRRRGRDCYTQGCF